MSKSTPRSAHAAVAFGLTAVTALGLAGCGGSDSEESKASKPSVLEAAYSTCVDDMGTLSAEDSPTGTSISPKDLMSLGDDGESITISNESSATGGFGDTLTAAAVSCLIGETDAPDSLGSEIEQTSAMMGRQSESWDDLTLEWSYHPDSGLSAVLKQSE